MTPEQRFICMAHNRAKNTTPEITLRHALWHRGFRYRMNDKRLPGKPDIVLPKYHTVIFIHGCFWHGHKGCRYYTIPKSNTEFWTAKVDRNQERDQRVWRELEAAGWSVIIVWECELKKANLEATIARVEDEIKRNGESYLQASAERRAAREAYRQEQKERKLREVAAKAELKR